MRTIYYIGLITFSLNSVGFAGNGTAPGISAASANSIRGGTNPAAGMGGIGGGQNAFEKGLAARSRLQGQISQINDAQNKLAEKKPRFQRSLLDAKTKVVGWMAAGDALDGSGFYDQFVANHPLVKLDKEKTNDVNAPVTTKPAAATAAGAAAAAPTVTTVSLPKVDKVSRTITGQMAKWNPAQIKISGVDSGDSETATSEASVSQIRGMMKSFLVASSAVAMPGDFSKFISADVDAYGAGNAPGPCNTSSSPISVGQCFNKFLDDVATNASNGFGSIGAKPAAKSAFHLPKIYRGFFRGLEWMLERVALAADQAIVGFFNGRVRKAGVDILTAKVAMEQAQAANGDVARLMAVSAQVAAMELDGNHRLGGAFDGDGFKGPEDHTYYQFTANQLANVVAPRAKTVVVDGLNEFNRFRDLETRAAADIAGINSQIEGLENQKKALEDELNDPNSAANNPQADSGGQSGGASGGGGSGAGGGGGGEGLKAAKGGEPLKFESPKFAGVPEGGSIAGGLGGLAPTDSRGSADRGALPSGQFTMPKIESTRGPNRTQPFSYASGAKNNNGPAQPGRGTTGSPMGRPGGSADGAANAGGPGGGGNPPVAGNGAGGGGFGAVPNVGGPEEGGTDRGMNSSFVKTTDYGGGGGEGGAGAGPDNGGDPGNIGSKIAAATGGSIGGVGFAGREIKENPRARGMGLMAYVGGFRDFCGEKRALGVGACGASSQSNAGRAFRSPSSDPVGALVAQRINANSAPARAFTTVTK